MAGQFCPIFDKQDGKLLSIGIWALDAKGLDQAISEFRSSGSIDMRMRHDLLSLAEPTLQFLAKARTRRIINHSIDVGNGVIFENGIFVMLEPYKAPNEELRATSRSVTFVLQMQDGIPMLKRSGPRPETMTTQVAQTKAEATVTNSTPKKKPWWQFWG